MIIASVSKTLSLHDPGVVQFPPLRLEYIANATNIRTKESNKRMEFLIKVNMNVALVFRLLYKTLNSIK